jgi:hypothetical protein
VVLQVPAPARLIEGGMPTEATVAHVLVSRYADHLPLYRQSQILADWTGSAAREVVPVLRRLHEILLASPRLFADETTMPVLDPGRGQTKKGFAWATARDDRPWGGTDPPAVVFQPADPPRQRLAQQSHRRAPALAPGHRRKRLSVKRTRDGPESLAYD